VSSDQFVFFVKEALVRDRATYEAELQAWRDQMEQSLRAADGWLALAGLFWLREGENSIGRIPPAILCCQMARHQRGWGVLCA
jgi:uncharacterized protein (DUF1684 family)